MKKMKKTGREGVVRAGEVVEVERKGRSLGTRLMVERIGRIHGALMAGDYPNAEGLARELEVSSKTVRRDLEFMRDRQGLPIEYDAGKRGFYYSEAVESFPMMQVSEGELLALLVAREAVESHKGTPYGHVLRGAFEKLASVLRDEVSFSVEDMPGAISFRTVGAAKVDEGIFLKVSKAVLERAELSFLYLKPGVKVPEVRRVQPYHLACAGGMWYLVAWDLERVAWRTFALVRMSGVEVSRHHFRRDPGFSPEKFFGGSFGMLHGEGEHRVRIGFDEYASGLVRERFWHASQKFIEKGQGRIELELCVNSLDEVANWVLNWGGRARALEPRGLVDYVREAGELLVKGHGKKSEK